MISLVWKANKSFIWSDAVYEKYSLLDDCQCILPVYYLYNLYSVYKDIV